MLNFRLANPSDLKNIARLHARSWQTAYKNVLSEDFLENEVERERLQYWKKKFDPAQRADNQWVLLAEKDGELLGFICVIGNENKDYGSLIDNLHVRPDTKGQGIGRQLLEKGLTHIRENFPDKGAYLWVFKNNQPAVNFYERAGGLCAELTVTENPDGGKGEVWRMIWAREKKSLGARVKAWFG